MSPHALTDERWTTIEAFILKRKPGPGRKRNGDRQAFNGILCVLKAGCPWEDASEPIRLDGHVPGAGSAYGPSMELGRSEGSSC
jgi:hypothetical protein